MSVAIGELADGLSIDLNKVTKKYEGLDGTELAISESQERMAVAVSAKDAAAQRLCQIPVKNCYAFVMADSVENCHGMDYTRLVLRERFALA